MEKVIRNESKHEVDMVNGPMLRNMIIVAIPLIFSGLLQLFYTAADLIVCGIFGSGNGVGAISSTNSLISLIVNSFMGISIGANVLMARTYGENNKEKAQRVLYSVSILAIIIGLAVGLFGFFFAKYFLEWMGTNSVLLDLSTDYLRIYFIGIPFLTIYNFGSAILRAIGDTRRPFIILLISGFVNILFNIFFVTVFNLDVVGVAIATCISQAISAVSIIILIMKHKGFFHFNIKEVRFYPKEARAVLIVGIPAGLQNAAFSISNILLQTSVNGLAYDLDATLGAGVGATLITGNGASQSLEGFTFVAMDGVSQTCAAFVSANYGAKNKKNILKVVFLSLAMVFAMNILLAFPILMFREELITLYAKNYEHYLPTIQTQIENRLFMVQLTYFTCGWMNAFAQAQRGIKHPLIPTIITLIGTCLLRIVWIYTFFEIPELHNLNGLMLSYPLSWLITVLTHMIFFAIMYKRLSFTQKDEERALLNKLK